MNNKNFGIKTEDKTELVTELAEAGRKLSEADLDLLMNDPDASLIYRDLLECKTALQMDSGQDAPNAEAEWRRFQQRIHPSLLPEDKTQTVTPGIYAMDVRNEQEDTTSEAKRRKKHVSPFVWGIFAGIAASLLIAIIYSWTTGIGTSPTKWLASAPPVSTVNKTKQYATSTTNKHSSTTNSQSSQTGATASSIASNIHGTQRPGITSQSVTSTSDSGKDNKLLADDATGTFGNNISTSNVKKHTASISSAKDLKVVLPDGTTVWLNVASRITYPEIFTGKERIVTLEGEAYFQVKHDPAHPFIIQTRNINARVLGTELNVSSYANKIPHVTLIKGKVEVGSATAGRITLRPGQDACLTDNGNIAVKEVDTAKYKYWKEGYLYFDNESLANAMQTIGSWYNVKIVFQKKRLSALRIHFFCDRHRPVEEAVANLNKIYNLEVAYKNHTIFIK